MKIVSGKKYLVTGGSGFLGFKLIERILQAGGSVSTISRNEGKLIQLKQSFPDIKIYTGDVCDPLDVRQAMKGCNGVFHLAAYKHVGLAESYSRECTRSNVIGSLNVLERSAELGCDFNLGISTDKAVQVSGIYGASKLIMEGLYRQFEKNYPNTKFRQVRYGNVLYSTGSVLCKWRDLLKEGKEVVVTDPSATRFFWTIDSAVDLIFECLKVSESSDPYVPDMKSMSVGDLLQAMANKYLPDGAELKIKTIGLQVGENLHEKVHSDGRDSSQVERFTIEEIMELI
tara:strand:+ start:10628 stop:11485 length:858 start_codon:yes stop_codon:yes gene_type:complete